MKREIPGPTKRRAQLALEKAMQECLNNPGLPWQEVLIENMQDYATVALREGLDFVVERIDKAIHMKDKTWQDDLQKITVL